eukprot:m.137772 g.137772  ORF g.137772 m.137772 type:complete len:201 (-) comp12332_c0_seq1:16-618(-)
MVMKVVILGDGGVGKSSLMQQFVQNVFNAENFHTIGVEFLNKDIEVNGETITMQIWDTAGQERFKSLRTPFYRGSDCCMLTFDLTDLKSFQNLNTWKDEFLKYAEIDEADEFPFVLLGNKSDKAERAVTQNEVNEWCAANGNMKYFATSAKTAENVENAFRYAATLLHSSLANESITPSYDTSAIDMSKSKSSTGSSGCC